jgi:hypothetical protein
MILTFVRKYILIADAHPILQPLLFTVNLPLSAPFRRPLKYDDFRLKTHHDYSWKIRLPKPEG